MTKKKLSIFLIVIFIMLFFINNSVLAVTQDDIDTFSPKIDTEYTEIKNVSSKLINTLLSATRIIGAGAAVIILMVIATKYLLATPSDKADIKKYAFNYIVGAVILLAASGVLTIIQKTVTRISA